MTTRKLDKPQWQPFFDNISRLIDGRHVEVEVDSLSIGAQVEAEWLPLIGIVYDRKDDLVEVAMDGLDHLIHNPREIFVEQDVLELHSLEVIDDEDFRHIVKLRDPLRLPAP